MKKALRYKNTVARIAGLTADEKGAELLKALAIGTQWRIDAALDAVRPLDWNYIRKKVIFEQAAMFGQLQAIKRMAKDFRLDPRRDPEVAEDLVLVAFDKAVIHGHYKIADYCKSLGAHPEYMLDGRYSSPRAMPLAVKEGNITKMKYLIEAGANPTHYLVSAVSEGNKTSVDFLLANGADINWAREKVWTPLGVAVQQGHDDLFYHLLDKGADPKVSVGESLYYAIGKGKVEIVKTLLERGVLQTRGLLSAKRYMEEAEYHKNDEIIRLLKKYMPKDQGPSTPKP